MKKTLSSPQILQLICPYILILTLVSCNSISQNKKRTEADSSNQKIHEVVNVLDLECLELASFIPVDSGIAKGLIPIEHNLYINEGKAEILFLAQNCYTAIWDENDISPIKKSHIWIRLAGKDTVVPVPGVDGTLPTFYWWDYKGMTSTKSLKNSTESSAWDMSLIDSIEFSQAEYGKLMEEINDSSQITMEWFTEAADKGVPLGINHILYGRNKNGELSANISGIIRPVSFAGKTRFEISANSPLSIFGSKLYGVSYDFDMKFQAVFKTTSK